MTAPKTKPVATVQKPKPKPRPRKRKPTPKQRITKTALALIVTTISTLLSGSYIAMPQDWVDAVTCSAPAVDVVIEGPTQVKAGRLAAFRLKNLVDPKANDLGIVIRPMPADGLHLNVLDFTTRELLIQFQTDVPGKYTVVVALYDQRQLLTHEFEVIDTTPPPPPTASIEVDPEKIKAGETSKRTWATAGADRAEIDGVAVGLSGSDTVRPTATTTYTLKAINKGGSTTDSATVTVGDPEPEPGKRFVLLLSESATRTPEFEIESEILRKYLQEKNHWFRFEDPDLENAQGQPVEWLKPYLAALAEKNLSLPVMFVVAYDGNKKIQKLWVESWPEDGEDAIEFVKENGG